MSEPAGGRSKLVATWLAVVGGSLGLHRIYLHGARDPWAWLHVPPTLVGAFGFWRMRTFGTDDRLGSLLVPVLGVMVAVGMLAALVHGLTPDERWNAGHGRGRAPGHAGWGIVFGVVVALAVGATVTMATVAFTAQRYFESQVAG
jgi:hypothetical protein